MICGHGEAARRAEMQRWCANRLYKDGCLYAKRRCGGDKKQAGNVIDGVVHAVSSWDKYKRVRCLLASNARSEVHFTETTFAVRLPYPSDQPPHYLSIKMSCNPSQGGGTRTVNPSYGTFLV